MSALVHRAPDPMYRNVLVPLDGTRLADGVLSTARSLAAHFGATLHTISVVRTDREWDAIRGHVAHALQTVEDDPRIHVEIDTDIAAAVHRCASALGACLICLASHGRGRVADAVIGSSARDIIERARQPVVVAGPLVAQPDRRFPVTAPLAVDHLVACTDGTPTSERGLPVAAAWAHALGMKLTIVTVAEPCPPPDRIGAPWRRHHGPNEDADEYVRRLAEAWALEAPGVDARVVYDPISAASGMRDYLAANPTGLVAVTSRRRDRLPSLVLGSGAASIVRVSTAPVLVVPA